VCIGSTASLEPFWSIAVDLDPEAKIITLKDALDCFFAEEKVRGCAGGGKRAGVGGAACCSDSRRKQSLRDDWRRDARRSQPPTAHPAWTPQTKCSPARPPAHRQRGVRARVSRRVCDGCWYSFL
jgi:hypothetical protein